MALLALNKQNLPYPDPLHPIVVQFVVAMVAFAFVCDVVGYFTHRHRLFEVSFWNWFVASVAVFVAVIFGQLEAGLAQPYYEAPRSAVELSAGGAGHAGAAVFARHPGNPVGRPVWVPQHRRPVNSPEPRPQHSPGLIARQMPAQRHFFGRLENA